MKVFISSVRRGLEEERDALPGLISALGHEPLRFEDFTAQDVPSREACLLGVQAADLYVLLLGAEYGDPLPDTGASPTEEEFTAARNRGIPIRVFRKENVDPDARQQEFIERVENYASGKFRDSFVTTADLLTAVAGAIREVASTPPALAWSPIQNSYAIEWVVDPQQSMGFVSMHAAILELHVIPIDSGRSVSVAELDGVAQRLSRVGRDAGFFDAGEGLDVGSDATFAWSKTQEHAFAERGVRLRRDGTLAIWFPLDRDSMGSIVDQQDLESKVSQMLTLAAEIGFRSETVTFGVSLGPTDWVTEGKLQDLGHRSSVSMGLRNGQARVHPEDAVPTGALSTGSREIARELVARLIHAFRAVKQ